MSYSIYESADISEVLSRIYTQSYAQIYRKTMENYSLHSTAASSVVDPDPHVSAFIWLSWIRIWIRTGNADPDPRARKLNEINKINLISSLSKMPLYRTYLVLRYVSITDIKSGIFQEKIQFLVTTKSDYDPDRHGNQ
jgi:hypothetical protein